VSNEVDVIRDDGGLEVLPPARPPVQSAMAILRAHAEMMDTAYQLAKAMCSTQMVPDRFKGKAHDGAAAILYGAEIGLNPIQSLQRIVPIHGMPTMEARTMVALLQARGYKVKVKRDEQNRLMQSDESVTVWGRDLDGEEYESTWTIGRAVKARYVPQIDEKTGKYRTNANGNLIGNEKYLTDPQAMLKAKAQSEVCRDMAPEVLLGISYSREDLESEEPFTAPAAASSNGQAGDAITAEEILADENPPEKPEQRRPPPPGWDPSMVPGQDERPPLVDPPSTTLPATVTQAAAPAYGQPIAEDMTPDVPDAQEHTPDRRTVQCPSCGQWDGHRFGCARKQIQQLKAEPTVYEHDEKLTRQLFALLRKAGVDNTVKNKPRRLAIYRFMTGRDDITSTNNLTPQELSEMVTALYQWDKKRVLAKQVDEILLAIIEDEQNDIGGTDADDAETQQEEGNTDE
jgi:hypothetical protein